MNPESSPFRPGQPIPIEFFVGRSNEVARLHGMVKASAQGHFKIGFVSGERGIGKSSLAHFVSFLAERESKVAGCHVFLGGVRDLEEMLRRTFDRLLKDSMDKPWHESIKAFFGNRVRKVGLFGVTLELNLAGAELSTLAHDFVPSIAHLLERVKDQNEAFLLILDDINGLATSEVFANWLKSIVDEVATSRKKIPLCMLFVGLEERRRELVEKQPSLARVFELIDIAPWSDDEVTEFYGKVVPIRGRDDLRPTICQSLSDLPAASRFWRTRSAMRCGARRSVRTSMGVTSRRGSFWPLTSLDVNCWNRRYSEPFAVNAIGRSSAKWQPDYS